MDMSAISTMLTSIKTATDIAKFIKESDLSLEKAEFKLKLAELVSALAEAKIQASEIQQALLDKDVEVRRLEDRLAVRGKIKWEQPYYWIMEDSQKDGPYCQNCYDRENNLIRLQGNGSGYWECKACKSNFTNFLGSGLYCLTFVKSSDKLPSWPVHFALNTPERCITSPIVAMIKNPYSRTTSIGVKSFMLTM